MTTTTETQSEQSHPVGFEISAILDGSTTLTNGDATFEVTPDSDVTVNDTGDGIQVKRTDEPAPEKANPSILFDGTNPQKVTTYGAAVTASEDGPAAVATNGVVTLVSRSAGENIAKAHSTKPETGLRLNLEDGHVTGEIDGQDFGIKGSNIVVDADRIQVKPAAEASADEKTDIHYSLSAKFNSVVVQGAKVDIRIEVAGDVSTVYTKTKGGLTIAAAESADKAVNGAAVEVNGNVTRLTLAAGKVFDVNTATGKVTAYTTSLNEEVGHGGNPEAADLAPVSADYKIVTSEDGGRVALNGSGIEKAEDGTLVAATDGVSQLKSVVVSSKRKMLHLKEQRKSALAV